MILSSPDTKTKEKYYLFTIESFQSFIKNCNDVLKIYDDEI